MDPIHITLARDVSRRALLGARLDDPVVPDSPSLLTRARRALASTRRETAPSGTARLRPGGDTAVSQRRSAKPLQ